MKQPAQNERKYYRLQTNFPIDIVVPSVAVPVPATLGDISEGGARVVSRSMLLRGTEIEFTLPRDGKVPLKLLGTIATIDFKQENRMFHYGVKYRNLRPGDSDSIYHFILEQQRRGLQQKSDESEPQTAQSGALRSVRERSAYRVEKNFPVRYSILGLRGSNDARAIDTSIGGMRIAFDRKMQIDGELDLRFTLPSDVLEVLTRREASRDGSIFGRTVDVKEIKARQFSELQVHAKLLPAMAEVKGRYIYSVTFVRVSNFVAEELQRYVHAAQLTELNKTRHGYSGKRLL
ncbi:MAG: PilZ domain-containing protein [Candidatus Baltobacteraceae bacterium]